jgi:UDP-N-acetylmuramate--alanine ligase
LASFQMFLQQVQADGKIWVRKGLELPADATYSGTSQADAYASNVVVKNGYFHFDYHDASGDLFDIALGVAGWHNVENAVVCIAIARHLGIADQAIVRALGNFKGVKRRFEYLVRQEKNVYIDDYAHHPEELSALIKSLRTLYPEWPLILVFQPHLFSRTRDFVDGFAEVLSRVDHLILMDIYPARELPIEGVTSSWLLDKITLKNKQLMSEEEVIAFVQQQSPQLLVTAGAGNIDRLVGPLTQILKNA